MTHSEIFAFLNAHRWAVEATVSSTGRVKPTWIRFSDFRVTPATIVELGDMDQVDRRPVNRP